MPTSMRSSSLQTACPKTPTRTRPTPGTYDDDKENNVKSNDEPENKATTPQGATPYWKAIQLDGRPPSPRETRSATKVPRKPQGYVMSFSPPDQKANVEREKKIMEQKEQQRSAKIAKARESGQLLVFSPAPSRKQKSRRATSCHAFTMDLSPDPKVPTPSKQIILAEEKIMSAELKLKDAQEEILKIQTRCDNLENQLHNQQIQNEHDYKELLDQLRLKEQRANELSSVLDKKNLDHAQLEKRIGELRAEQENDKGEILLREQTIRELSSVLQMTTEKEKALEINLAKVKEESAHIPRDKLHSNDEFIALQIAKAANESLLQETNAQLKEAKKNFEVLERELNESKVQLKTECTHFELLRNSFEDQKRKLISEKEESEKDTKLLKQKILTLENELEYFKQQLQTSETSNSALLKSFNDLKQECDQMTSKIASLTSKLDSTNQTTEKSVAKVEFLESELKNARSLVKKLQDDLENTTDRLRLAIQEREDDQERVTSFQAREEALQRKLIIMDDIRSVLHNKVMALSGNIRVFVRVRPLIDEEREKLSMTSAPGSRGLKRKQPDSSDDSPFMYPDLFDRGASSSGSCCNPSCDDITEQVIVATEPFKDRGGLNNRQKKWTFGFDRVFSPNHKQEEVWVATEPLVQSAIDGFNVCIFAYGQTGSGKTHTMIGGSSCEKGIVYRSVEKIFEAKKELESSSRGTSVEISVELLEIYNEDVRDLLSFNNRQKKQSNSLRIVSNDAFGNVVATVQSQQDVFEILLVAASKRCVKATNSNLESSRSHMLFTIHFVVQKDNKKKRVGKLHVIDLAGSERLEKSGCHMMSDGSLLKETKNINKSLMCLSNVIEKLQAKESHVPYRDSKLTMLLQNSLGGDSKTLAIVCCNPLPEHFNESMSSIRFASKVSRVELKAMAKICI